MSGNNLNIRASGCDSIMKLNRLYIVFKEVNLTD